MKCPSTGKTMYNSQKKAHACMMRIYSHDPNAKFGDLETYRCGLCHRIHVRHTDRASKEIHSLEIARAEEK